MKKFKFSLEKVLNHRLMKADLAQKDFLEAQGNLQIEIEKYEEMKLAKLSAEEKRAETVQQTQSWSASVEQINLYLSGQDVRISRQNERLIDLEKVVESKREILQEALTEAKIIEKLRETKKMEFASEVMRLEQQEMDELSVMRFSKNERVS